MIRRCAIIVLALLLVFSASGETVMHAVSVGKGDAIIISVGDENYLIDTAKAYAGGRIGRALRELGIEYLDGVFITHVDSDHIDGVDWLLQSGIRVDKWYASPCFFEFKEKKHPLVKNDLDPVWLEAGDTVDVSGGKFTVLAPLQENPDEENDNSLVMMLETSDGRVLLTGDMEFPEEKDLLASAQDLSCDVLKVSNHGDGDATSAEFLEKSAPEIAVISTDSWEKPGTPAPEVLAGLEYIGAETFVTEGSDAVRVTLDSGNAAAECIKWDSSHPDDISLSVDTENELFTIDNHSDSDINISGWYVYSEKGDDLFVIPEYIVSAGGRVIIGTKTAPDGAYQILWDEKNVISNKKYDPVSLYDRDGNFVSGM